MTNDQTGCFYTTNLSNNVWSHDCHKAIAITFLEFFAKLHAHIQPTCRLMSGHTIATRQSRSLSLSFCKTSCSNTANLPLDVWSHDCHKAIAITFLEFFAKLHAQIHPAHRLMSGHTIATRQSRSLSLSFLQNFMLKYTQPTA